MGDVETAGAASNPALQMRSWYGLAAVIVVSLVATLVVGEGFATRIVANDVRFAAEQRTRLQRVERRVDDYFGDAEQLARILTATVGHAYDDRGLTGWLVRETFRGARNHDTYGLGAAWAPYRFESASKFVRLYDRAPDGSMGSHSVRLSRTLIETRVFGDAHQAFDYTKDGWYRTGVAAGGRTAYYGPYREGSRSFVSVVRAFYRTHNTSEVGPLAGVVSVDILTSRLVAMLDTGASSSDAVWLQLGDGGRIDDAYSGSAAGRDTLGLSLPLRYAGATLHVDSDASALHAANRSIVVLVWLVIAVIWLLCGIVGYGIWQRARLVASRDALAHEVAVAQRVASELRKTAFVDTLTGLPNRAAIVDRTAAVLASGASGRHVVLLADLDRFSVVNETLGLRAGDDLLRALADRFFSRFGAEAYVGRCSNEFGFLASTDDGPAFAERILAALREPVVVDGQTIYASASVGVVAVEPPYEHAEDVLRDAQIAVHRAKRRGRSRWEIFDAAMRADVARDSELESDLRDAIENHAFVPYYQPIVRIATGKIASFEALARWRRGDTVVEAGSFIPFAEEQGLAYAIDAQILRTVCSHAAIVSAVFPGAPIAVNVSAAELGSRDLAASIEALLAEFGIDRKRLQLEITETAMMAHTDDSRDALDRLRALGIAMLLDDFGTGYSSLAYLQQLPIVGLKIDRSFVERLGTDERAHEIVHSIVALAEAFDLETTAEGVESAEQLAILGRLGVHFAQGYLFSPALDVSALSTLQTPTDLKETS